MPGVCQQCMYKTDGKLYLVRDNGYCLTCARKFLPTCKKCGEAIIERGVFPKCNQKEEYHEECFCCANCTKPIKGKFVTAEAAGLFPTSVYYCEDCHAMKSKKEPVICAGCRKPIIGRFTVVDGNNFHPSCFKCSNCHQCITGLYTEKESGTIHCSMCTNKRGHLNRRRG